MANKIAAMLYAGYDNMVGSSDSWADQFKNAVIAAPGTGGCGMFMFWLNAPWRLLFAFVPPPSMLGGWLCFCIALVMIAGVTALIGDLASLLGCSIGLKVIGRASAFLACSTSS